MIVSLWQSKITRKTAERKLSDDFFRAMKEDEFYIKNENVEDCYLLLETTIISISGRLRQGLAPRQDSRINLEDNEYKGYRKE